MPSASSKTRADVSPTALSPLGRTELNGNKVLRRGDSVTRRTRFSTYRAIRLQFHYLNLRHSSIDADNRMWYLVRQDEDDQSSAQYGFGKVALRDYIRRQLYAGQVLDVLMVPVDHVRQARFLVVVQHLFRENPLLYFALEPFLMCGPKRLAKSWTDNSSLPWKIV